MITSIILFLIITPILLYIDRNHMYDYRDILANIFYSGIVSTLLTVVISVIVCNKSDFEVIKTEQIKLISLSDNDGINGNFFIGSGYINQEQYYTYYVNTNKGMKRMSMSADDCYIKYADSNYRLEWKILKLKTRHLHKWFYFLNISVTDDFVFYVPKNSVKSDYTLNNN